MCIVFHWLFLEWFEGIENRETLSQYATSVILPYMCLIIPNDKGSTNLLVNILYTFSFLPSLLTICYHLHYNFSKSRFMFWVLNVHCFSDFITCIVLMNIKFWIKALYEFILLNKPWMLFPITNFWSHKLPTMIRRIWWDELRDFFSSFPRKSIFFSSKVPSYICSELTEIIQLGIDV